MHPMLNTAIAAARKASKVILPAMDQLDRIQVQSKGLNDFVSSVDRAAEETIVEVLRQAYPHHSILAEEGTGEYDDKDEFCWLIDPLDGSANFLHGIPHFAISIALKHHNRIEVGLVYDPINNELFLATHGEGAQLNGKRIRVSRQLSLPGALLATGFPFRHHQQFPSYLKMFAKLFPQVSDMRRTGSAALDLAYVAAGRYDGFWEWGLNIWDFAAGILLVKEAGGSIFDFKGEKQYLDSGNIIAANTALAEQIAEVAKAVF